ncbi:ABC transporter substrate-binding protein [Paenibacillus hemerocallicola]|uniref:ABC transporter substrate-binding protein n=1 Tax=Paenibacillus hemerocallicola TaxID=1172614 RepID=A0A5C4SVA8_9BACL|nr:ABC transporter substrate-binding protein [Paenibacillus hemerocallicola]TNJ55596.1 ABC transporter substrate-binding protein [Paenibacillus hemerocallicola]
MRTIRNRLLLCTIALSLTFLAACGNEGTGGAQTAGSGTNGQASSSSGATAPQQPAKQESAPAVNKFKHELGEIQVPANPKRITALYMEDFLVALGIKPVTQTVIGSFSLKYLQPSIGDLPKLDTSAMNFEAALAAQPDLILLAFPNYGSEGKYEKYSKIAPTYVFGNEAPDAWRDTLRKVGELTGKKAEAEKVLTDYANKLTDAKKKLSASIGNETVALLRVRSNKEIRLYGGPLGYSGNVLYNDLGLTPPDIVKKLAWGDNGGMAVVSMEIIPQLQVDHLLITYDDGGKELAKEIFESNVWKALPAVQKGHLYEVSLDHWMTFGPVAYNKKVDDVVKALVK